MTDPDTSAEAVVSWQSWIDDLPLPECFNAGQDACQEFISALAAERDALRARAEAAEAERDRLRRDAPTEAALRAEVERLREAIEGAGEEILYGCDAGALAILRTALAAQRPTA